VAAYEGQVHWSGDLGHGVQPPPLPQSELDEREATS
jgi:hypothetical protein